MKNFRRMLCLLLALLSLATLVPMTVLAAEPDPPAEPAPAPSEIVTIDVVVDKKTLYSYKVTVSDEPVRIHTDQYMEFKKKIYEFVTCEVSGQKYDSVTIPAYDETNQWKKDWKDTISLVYKTHKHSYTPGYSRVYHWNICACGSTTNAVRHVDPATDSDKVCTCGYAFSDNTQLTTLWFTNVRFDTKFNKETREYTATVVDSKYKDVTSTTIRAGAFDAMATVTLPENLEIHEGSNKFVIYVLAEDRTAMDTYTVTVIKPTKVGNTAIYPNGTDVYIESKAKVKKKTAYIDIAEEVAAKMAEMAAEDNSSILFKTSFSKWSIKQVDLTVPASFFKTLAEKTKADVKVETPYGTTLVIPHGDLAALPADRETLVLRIGKDNSFAVLAGEEELTLSDKVQLILPETK